MQIANWIVNDNARRLAGIFFQNGVELPEHLMAVPNNVLMMIRDKKTGELIALSVANSDAELISEDQVPEEYTDQISDIEINPIQREMWETLAHLKAVPIWRHTHTTVRVMDAGQKGGLILSLLFDEST